VETRRSFPLRFASFRSVCPTGVYAAIRPVFGDRDPGSSKQATDMPATRFCADYFRARAMDQPLSKLATPPTCLRAIRMPAKVKSIEEHPE